MSEKLDGITVVAIPGLWGSEGQFVFWEGASRAPFLSVNPTRNGNDRGAEASHVLDSLGGKKIVIGHSLGALSAAKLASRPDVVAMVLVAPAGPWPVLNLGWWTAMRIWKYMIRIVRNQSVLVSSEDASTLLFNKTSTMTRDIFWRKLVPERGWTLLKAIVWPEKAKRPGCPTLVVRGTADQMVPLWTQSLVASRHKATVLDFDMGHMVPMEASALVVWTTIEAWLEEVIDN